MFKRVIYILLLATLVISGCSTFPVQKAEMGTYVSDHGQTFQVLLEYEHEDTEEIFSGDDIAHMAHLVTEQWREDPVLPFPERMETCLAETHHYIADDATVNDLCDSKSFKACNYTERNLRVGEGYDSPYDSISIYRESLSTVGSCYTFSSIVAHEFTHKMEECLRDQAVRDNGDRDHKEDHLWYRHTDWGSFEAHASERIATTLVHETCGYPYDTNLSRF